MIGDPFFSPDNSSIVEMLHCFAALERMTGKHSTPGADRMAGGKFQPSGAWARTVLTIAVVTFHGLTTCSAFASTTHEKRWHPRSCVHPHLHPHQRLGSSLRARAGTTLESRSGTLDDVVAGPPNHRPPRLVSGLETAIRSTIRLLFISRCSSFTVKVTAPSNRALLRGSLDSLSISARNCIFRFGVLQLSRWEVSGANLRLGYVPLILPILPLVIWRIRGFLWSLLFGMLVMRSFGLSPEAKNPIRALSVPFWLGARPSSLNCSVAVSNDDVANSSLLRLYLRWILRSLVMNSVVGAAAAFGDAATSVRKDIDQMQKQQRKQQQHQGGANAVPLLPSKDTGTGVTGKSSSALAAPGATPKSSSSFGGGSQQQQQQQQGLTSELLSATSFELKGASFTKDRVVFEADAVMPPKRGDNRMQKSRLAFTIRARIEPTVLVDGQSSIAGGRRRKYNALAFTNPECRLCTAPLLRNSFLGRVVPNTVWVPFGSGVAVPFGEKCEIYRAEASIVSLKGVESDDGIFRIDGAVTLFSPEAQNSTGSNDPDGSIIMRNKR